MIHFDPRQESFHLQGPSYSYIIAVKDGVLLHLYWGARLPQGPAEGLFRLAGDAASFDTGFSRLPFELPTQEKGYFGQRAINVVNGQGDDVVSLRYAGHRIFEGKQKLPGLPAS